MQISSQQARRRNGKSMDLTPLERRGYSFGKTLGKGSYGCVMKARFKDPVNGTIQELACKFINKTKAPADFLEKFFPRELQVLQQINHPNIIRVHSILQCGSSVFIFMRCAEYGDLLDYIKNFGKIDETQANLWFFQITSAIRYLHSLDFAHRDLKCENLLISKHLNIKIADFGFARETMDESGQDIMSSTFCGSAAYAPPEIVGGIPYHPKKADVWSMGVILAIMLFAAMPFGDSNMKKLREDQKARRMNVDGEVFKKLSPECKDVLSACLTPDVDLRPDVEKIYNMQWLAKRVLKSRRVNEALDRRNA